MSDRFLIARVRGRVLDVPMRKAFGIAGGAQEVARNVVAEVELRGGEVGYGEAAPLPAFNGETQDDARVAIERAGPMLEGGDARRWRALSERLRAATVDEVSEGVRASASGACALETAVLDALARAENTSLLTLFGGAETALVTDVTITTGTPAVAEEEARAFHAFKTLKIKVGGADVDVDVARVLAVAAARPDARLLLDANGGLDADEALYLVRALAKRGCIPALFEQPIAAGDMTRFADLRARLAVPLALDESVTTPDDVHRAADARAADAVNVKIMKSGIALGLAITAAARARGLATMIGGMVETRLAMGTSACLAAGVGGFAHVDLDTPLFLVEDPWQGGYVQDGERIDLSPIDRGHGMLPRR